mmetsp:Transcript_28171/g.45353  ORF Transcript_28171/g.45353 Transcript_28171/m.45353 type:complete len:121 (-) Transcript_28171:18-380(-)
MGSNLEDNTDVEEAGGRYDTRLRRQRGILKQERGGNPTPTGLMMVVVVVMIGRVGFRMKVAEVTDDSDMGMIMMIIQGKDIERDMTTVLGTRRIDIGEVLRSIIDCSMPPLLTMYCKCTE